MNDLRVTIITDEGESILIEFGELLYNSCTLPKDKSLEAVTDLTLKKVNVYL
jgi:hypothetical protein